jgi:hypothetical protein
LPPSSPRHSFRCLPGIHELSWATAGLGVFIVVAEGLQQLYRFQSNWIAYRSTSEALKHEKLLYLAKAGIYAIANDAHALLAERIESLVSQEHAKWASTQEQGVGAKPKAEPKMQSGPQS